MQTGFPFIVPIPVITPSPGNTFLSIPKFLSSCSTKRSNSVNEFSSRSAKIRSRAVSLPIEICFSIAASPPPFSATAFNSRSSSIFFCKDINKINYKLLILISCKDTTIFWNKKLHKI